MDDVIIFQKLTSQELIILSALDHLESEETTSKKTMVNKREANNKISINGDDLEDGEEEEEEEEEDD